MTIAQPTSESRDPARHSHGRGKVGQAHEAFVELLSEATRRGFHGAVSLTLTVQDGAIQHVRLATERTLR